MLESNRAAGVLLSSECGLELGRRDIANWRQEPAVDGRFLAWSGAMGGRVGGGRSSVSEEVMSFASFSSALTLLSIWATVRSQRALIREAHWHHEAT